MDKWLKTFKTKKVNMWPHISQPHKSTTIQKSIN